MSGIDLGSGNRFIACYNVLMMKFVAVFFFVLFVLPCSFAQSQLTYNCPHRAAS
jgi:hypothetical protein